MDDATTRFSRRVNDYVRYRPGYPEELEAVLRRRIGYHRELVVADVGSGTGISSRYFLDRGNMVYAVEPNDDMRSAAEEWLGTYSKFRSVAGSAEDTTLEAQCVDLVVAAQAFHWFDAALARREFERVLRPRGAVVLLWNERKRDATPFLIAYESLLRHISDDYRRISRSEATTDSSMDQFFGPERWGSEDFPNRQAFDLEGLIGRALSSSYVPLPGSPRHDEMLDGLRRIFAQHAVDGRVWFEYATRLFWGYLRGPSDPGPG
ncbi:MAG TPA: class I SAM-dependent methyltransferase [Polyangiaceae bacterium]